jgi:hypothetical protein
VFLQNKDKRTSLFNNENHIKLNLEPDEMTVVNNEEVEKPEFEALGIKYPIL